MVVGPCRGLALLLLQGPGLRGAGTKNSPAALSLPWSLQLGTASGPGPGVTLARLLEALLGGGVRLGGPLAASPEALSRSPSEPALVWTHLPEPGNRLASEGGEGRGREVQAGWEA